MDFSSIRGLLSALGFTIKDVTVNPLVIGAMLAATHMLRMLAAKTLLPREMAKIEVWLDRGICWLGNPAWAVFVVSRFEAPMPWGQLVIYALTLDAFAVLMYERFGRQALERLFGQVAGVPSPGPPAGSG